MVPAVQIPPQVGRRLAVTAATAAAAALGTAIAVWLTRLALSVAGSFEDADTADLLTALSAVGCAVVMVRLSLSLAAVAVIRALPQGTIAHRRGCRVALALSPRWTRPAVALLLATGVTAGSGACTRPPPVPALTLSAEVQSRDGPTAPALHDAAGTAWLGRSVLPEPVWTALPEPGWLPSPPPAAPLLPAADAALVTSGAQRASGSLPRAARAADDRVVVRRGDSLWGITERHLGPGASDAEVAAQWPRWWRANRSVIGPDPDLLLPGMRLTPPAP